MAENRYGIENEYEFDLQQEGKIDPSNLPSCIMADQRLSDRQGTFLNSDQNLFADNDEVEMDDGSYSDIDESMDRYNKRKGIKTSVDRSATGTFRIEKEFGKKPVAKKQPQPRIEDKPIRISQLLEKNQQKQNEFKKLTDQKNINLQTFKCEPPSERRENEKVFKNDMTTINKDDSLSDEGDGDQSTFMNHLRRQMSTNYRKQGGKEESDQKHTTNSGSNYVSQRNLHEKAEFDDLETDNYQKTDRTYKNNLEERRDSKSPTMSYVESSVQNTHREKNTNGHSYKISKYQDSSVADEIREQENYNIDATSLASSETEEQHKSYQQSTIPVSHQQSIKQLDTFDKIHIPDSEYRRLTQIINPTIKEEVYGSSSRTNTVSQTDIYRPSTIQEADTCQEETNINQESIVYNNTGPYSINDHDQQAYLSKPELNTQRTNQEGLNQEQMKAVAAIKHQTMKHTRTKQSKQSSIFIDDNMGVMSVNTKSSAIEEISQPTFKNSQVESADCYGQQQMNQIVQQQYEIQLSQSQQLLKYQSSKNQNYYSSVSDSKKVPFIKSYPNKQFRSRSKPRKQYEDQAQKQQFQVPSQKLMVVCIIKKESSKEKEDLQIKSRSNDKFNGQRRGARSISGANGGLGSRRRSQSSWCNRSQQSSRSIGSTTRSMSQMQFNRKQKQIRVKNMNNSFDTEFLDNLNSNVSTIQKQIKKQSGPKFFTTHHTTSQLIFKQLYEDRINKKVIKTTLRHEDDCAKFITGLKKVSVDDESNMRLYKFDKCISESQHSKIIQSEANAFLRQWFIQCQDQEIDTLNFCFLFGSGATNKSESLNLMKNKSIIQEFLKEMTEPMQFLRVSMFFQDQEFILNHRKFDSTKQSSREIGMEIREALRDKNRLVQKLTTQQPSLAVYIQKCSHFRIQINNYIFIDMADLRGLQFHQNPEIVQTLTNDFGSMTNEILRQSEFYQNHDFEINEEQETSAFNTFLRENVTTDSKIMLLTFISNDISDETSSSIALDFSHKIRSYYSGNSDDCYTSNFLLPLEDSPLIQDHFQKLTMIFSKLIKMESRVCRELQKVRRTNCFQAHNQIQSHNRLVELLRNLHLLVIDAIDTDLTQSFDQDHIRYIKTIINDEIEGLQKKIDEVGTMMKKLPFSKISIKNETQKLKDFKIVITNQNQGSRERNLPFQTQAIDSTMYRQINTSSSKGSMPYNYQEQTKRQRSGSSIRNRPVSASGKVSVRPTSSLAKTGSFKGSNTRPGSSIGNKAPRQVGKVVNSTRAPIHQSLGSTTQRSSTSKNNLLCTSGQRTKSKDKKIVSKTRRVSQNKQKNSNLDLPIQQELTNEIEQSLISLKMKRNLINLDVENHLVKSYDFDSKENLKQNNRFSDNLISLNDIENVEEKMNSERTFSKQTYTLGSQMGTLKYSDNSKKSKNKSKERSRSNQGVSRKSKQKENDSRRSNPKITQEYKPFQQNNYQELDHIPQKHGAVSSNPFKDQPMILDQQSPVGRNLQNRSPVYLHSQVSQELMLQNTAQRTIVHENEGLKNEIISLQTQLQFQKSEFETLMAIKDIELQNSNDQVSKLQKLKTKQARTIEDAKHENEQILQMQNEIEHLKMEKQKAEDLNKKIMSQVTIMKDAIKESRECEILNKELLESNKAKNEKINSLKNQEKMLLDQVSRKDQYIKKLKERIQLIEYNSSPKTDNNKLEEVQGKYKALKVQFNELVDEIKSKEKQEAKKNKEKEQDSDLEMALQEQQEQNIELEKAKDRFRNQTLDQKQEIRKLKSKIEYLQSFEMTKSKNEAASTRNENFDESQGSLASQNTMTMMRSVDDKQLLSITAQIKKGVQSIKRDSSKENVQSVSTVNKNYDTFRSIKSNISSQKQSSDTQNRKAEVINDIKSLIKDYKKDNLKQ